MKKEKFKPVWEGFRKACRAINGRRDTLFYTGLGLASATVGFASGWKTGVHLALCGTLIREAARNVCWFMSERLHERSYVDYASREKQCLWRKRSLAIKKKRVISPHAVLWSVALLNANMVNILGFDGKGVLYSSVAVLLAAESLRFMKKQNFTPNKISRIWAQELFDYPRKQTQRPEESLKKTEKPALKIA